MMARKEGRNAGQGRASARAGRVPPFLQQTVQAGKGTGRERERCCGQQHGLIRLIPGTMHYMSYSGR